MATITPTKTEAEGGCFVISWVGITSADTCTPARFAGAPDRTVQIDGTFDGATIALQGTLDADAMAYATLTDPQGNAISATSTRLEAVTENVRFVKPTVTSAGGGSTSVNVYLLVGGVR